MTDTEAPADREPITADVDALIIGAGFAGLYAHHRLRALGLELLGFEAASDVGGTWWWNRYPGARCDIESMDYSYSFDEGLQQEWTWSERYATQPEILRYAEHVADRFDLRRDIHFDTRVTGLTWNDDEQRWHATTDRGDAVSAQFCVMATGCLSTLKKPDIPGADDFAGPTYHTGQWPHHDVDFTGQRVGVIGTGSSGIQSIPLIAQQAEHLTVFQRTPNFALPARNAPLDPEWQDDWKRHYAARREAAKQGHVGVAVEVSETSALSVSPEEREATFREAWDRGTLFAVLSTYNDLLIDERANETAAEFVRERIRESVDDPVVAELLSPRTYPFGTKRACLDTDYYATYNRPNVTLVDLRATPIEAITATGVRTTEQTYELDALVFATGFDAVTGPVLAIDPVGRDGVRLSDKWADGPRTYLGIATAGFPNLFLVTGPGSPSVLTNMIVSIEQHVDWLTDCIAHLRAEGQDSIDADVEAEDGWVTHVNEVADLSLYPRASSWYMGANVPGKPRVFLPYLGGVPLYREICHAVAADGYRGFTFRKASAPVG